MNLKFGIEIEFYGVKYTKVIDELRNAGIAVADYNGYTHEVIPQWKITTDSSVTGADTGLYRGLELVSPILYDDEGLEELEIVYSVLNKLGAKVDKTCGTHVHFDIAEFTYNNVKSFINLYKHYQPVINYLLPKSRRDNPYCNQIRNTTIKRINDYYETPRKEWDMRRLANIIGTRYSVINLSSYLKYGTLELRQHGGTIEFEKIEAWIVLMYQLLQFAETNDFTVSSTRGATRTYKNLNELLEKANLTDTIIADYITARFKHFKEAA